MSLSLLLLTLTLSGLARSQTDTAVPHTLLYPTIKPTGSGGGAADLPTDRITAQQTAVIQARIKENLALLAANHALETAVTQTVTFTWPLSAANGLADYGYHGVSGFVDHDGRYPNFLLDYNCGSRTYDTISGYNHQGTDYFTWPFPWQKMADNAVIAIAAADGTIVWKQDGNDDHSCSFNNNDWNMVSIRHSDGSIAWYGHLKNGSVISKGIGSTVAAGEYLGVVGSSGNSTGPHLHLELYDPAFNLLDPYQGSCNQFNANSWWAAQRPYYDSAVNKLMTGSAPVSFQTCPTPDIANEQNSFAPGATLYLTAFYRDQLSTQTSDYAIYQPDNTLFQSWSHSSNFPHYAASYWWWAYDLPANAPTGTWRFEVIFNGATYEKTFAVIIPKFLTVTSPTGGEFWQPGSTYTITWQDNITDAVSIDLYHGGTLSETIIPTATNSGFYTWTIPISTAVRLGYQIRATDLGDTAVYDNSSHFAIGRQEQFSFLYLPIIHKE